MSWKSRDKKMNKNLLINVIAAQCWPFSGYNIIVHFGSCKTKRKYSSVDMYIIFCISINLSLWHVANELCHHLGWSRAYIYRTGLQWSDGCWEINYSHVGYCKQMFNSSLCVFSWRSLLYNMVLHCSSVQFPCCRFFVFAGLFRLISPVHTKNIRQGFVSQSCIQAVICIISFDSSK